MCIKQTYHLCSPDNSPVISAVESATLPATLQITGLEIFYWRNGNLKVQAGPKKIIHVVNKHQ